MNNLRILALDLRTQRFGFAVLEGPDDLLDWGTRRSRRITMSDPRSFIRKRLAPLIQFYAPAVIVVKRGSRQGSGSNSRQKYLLQTVRDEGQRQAVAVVVVGRKEIQTAFGKAEQASKEAIANKVALAFPQLSWNLPPPRKAWANEAHAMTVFDAVAVGLTYFERLR